MGRILTECPGCAGTGIDPESHSGYCNECVKGNLDVTEDAIDRLESGDDFRVLRKLVVPQSTERIDYNPFYTGEHARFGLIVDCETTGLSASDRLIQFGAIKFGYDGVTQEIVSIEDMFLSLDDPHVPISPEAFAVHRIKQEDLQGAYISQDDIDALTDDVDIVIAHQASFDRRMIEHRFPKFKMLNWACSIDDVRWQEAGYAHKSLEYILLKQGFFFDQHNALGDCFATLTALRAEDNDGKPFFMGCEQASRRTDYRLWANKAPYAAKDAMKEHGYSWDSDRKTWYIRLPDHALESELCWLHDAVYSFCDALVFIDTVTAKDRYTERVTDSKTLLLQMSQGLRRYTDGL